MDHGEGVSEVLVGIVVRKPFRMLFTGESATIEAPLSTQDKDS